MNEHVQHPGLMPYQFEGNSIRIVDRDGEFWFVASDVARELGHAEAAKLTRLLDADEKGLHSVATLGGVQELSVISEPGLYRAIVQRRANKTADHTIRERIDRFQRWVFHDVLPSIRKTGGYGRVDPMQALNDPSALRGLLLTYSEKVIALEAKVEEQSVDVAALDRIAKTNGAMTLTDAAKTIGIPPHQLFRYVDSHGWTYRRIGNAERIAYQTKISAGYLDHKTKIVPRPDGSEKTVSQVVVLPAGLTKLAKEFSQRNLL